MLNGVPMLTDLSVLVKSEEIHGYILIIAGPGLVRMESDEISFCDAANEFD